MSRLGIGIGLNIGGGAFGSGTPAVTVGGYAVGQAGAAGSLWEGYSLAYGNDFLGDDTSFQTAATPNGKLGTTKNYGNPMRTGVDGGALQYNYDWDPWHTGYEDYNRGVPVPQTSLTIGNSIVKLSLITGTTLQRAAVAAFPGVAGRRIHAGAGVYGVYDIGYYIGSGGAIIDYRMRYSDPTNNPRAAHTDIWTSSTKSVISGAGFSNRDACNWEGNSQSAQPNQNTETSGVNTNATGSFTAYPATPAFHTYSFKQLTTEMDFYIDQVFKETPLNTGVPAGTNTKSKPTSWLMTNHLYDASWNGDTYNATAIADFAGGKHMDMECDWIRVWLPTGSPVYSPSSAQADVNIAFGGATTITLPSAATLWGDATVTEYMQQVMTEGNEPGGSYNASSASGYNQFSSSVVSWDSAGSRQLVIQHDSLKAGRMTFHLQAYKSTGSACVPLVFHVNVGPRYVGAGLLSLKSATTPIDLYPLFDCGVLVTDSNKLCAKTITVSGLPSGFTYNSSTFLITPDGTQSYGVTSLTVTCTNSLGQQIVSTIPLVVPSFLDSANLIGLYDFSDTTKATLNGSSYITAFANSKAGNGDLTMAGGNIAGGGGGWKQLLDATRNRYYGNMVANVNTQAALVKAEALSTDAVSLLFGGDDTPHSVVVAKTPRGTASTFSWSASKTIDATNANVIAGVKGNTAAASTYRRRASTSGSQTSNTWGAAGEAVGTPRTQGYRTTGIAVTVYDNNITTPVLNGAAQNQAAMATDLVFGLGTTRIEGASSPTWQLAQGDTDYYMAAIFNADVGNTLLAAYVKEIHALNFGAVLT